MGAFAVLACGGPDNQLPGSDAGSPEIDAGPDAPPDGDGGMVDNDPCPDLFAQEFLPEWHISLNATEWAELNDEFLNRVERDAAGLDINPYHPVASIVYDDGRGPIPLDPSLVLIRLKGQSSWVQTVQLDPNPKMQFVIAFNEVNGDGRFNGVRKVELDMPRSDTTFIRQRLALHIMREVGQDAQCANNAKLYLNGEYYGLFTHLERLDKEFLQRVYGKENDVDDGDLWKSGVEIRTNEENHSEARINAFWAASSVAELEALADLDDAVYEWAAEAVLPHADGFQIGRHNFFLYDHPERGFLWLPHDVDTAFDYYPHDLDLAFPECSARNYSWWRPYATTLAEPMWMERYIDALAAARGRYDPSELVELVDAWTAQIRSAAEADLHRPFEMDDHDWALSILRDHLHLRAQFIDEWLQCRADGLGDDWDGDGVVFCHDCNDFNSEISPQVAETCNGVDDNCNGFVDEGLSCP